MYNNKYYFIRYIKLSIIFFQYFIFSNYFFYIKTIFFYINRYKEIKKIENYLLFCNGHKLKNQIIYNNNKNPNISIISPIYNSEKYISRFIKSIQYQNFYNIELILTDDNSVDNSVKIIEKYKKEDLRIILIKNKKNKGTFINRYLGILFSKGKYIYMPDPDDIIGKNILKVCYKIAQKYKYEIIRFNIYNGNGRILYTKLYEENDNKPIYQPYLRLYLYYGRGELHWLDVSVHNKIVKREAFIKAIYLLNKYYRNLHMTFAEDAILTFILYITAKSYFYLKNIGYFYIQNNKSITQKIIYRLKLKAIFIHLKFIFDYYKNNKYERDISNLILINFINVFYLDYNIINKLHSYDKRELTIYYNTLNSYLNCVYITNENKKRIQYIKIIIGKLINNI